MLFSSYKLGNNIILSSSFSLNNQNPWFYSGIICLKNYDRTKYFYNINIEKL